MVLHIGCSQIKQKTGKHLYLKGLKKFLRDLDSELEQRKYRGKMLVLVSEWGLEHATKYQINKICGESLKGFDNKSPIIETINLLKINLEKIVLLPADIGLMIGMESGNIYLNDAKQINPENIKVYPTQEGLSYIA